MKRNQIQRELAELTVGHSSMIAWEAVTRWAVDAYEIGTWGKKQDAAQGTLDTLCRMRNVA